MILQCVHVELLSNIHNNVILYIWVLHCKNKTFSHVSYNGNKISQWMEYKRELLADKEVNLNTLTRTITEKGEYTVMFFMVSPTKKQHNSKRNNSPNRCDDCFHTFHRRACWSYTTNNVVSRNLRVTLKLPKWWIFSHPTHHQMTVLLTYNYVPFGATTTIFALYL